MLGVPTQPNPIRVLKYLFYARGHFINLTREYLQLDGEISGLEIQKLE